MAENKKIITTIASLVIALLAINVISAEFWSCFEKGDVVHYCSNYKPDWTCDSTSGCEKCISVYREAENCYIHGVWATCMQVSQECSTGGSGGTIDSEPPVISINSPINGGTYGKYIYISGESNEIADWYYRDNLDERGFWRKICSSVSVCNQKTNFGEGENNISIKAEDKSGNEAVKEAVFFVDSKKPIISKTLPKKGFVDGNFEIQFKEENPASLVLHYGTKTKNINLNDCTEEKKKTYCDSFADLKEFDGTEINYWYTLTDIAGTIAESKPIMIKVDTTAPIINNPSSFWTQSGKYIYFNISITENNFDEAGYSYIDSRGRMREFRLCSTLKNGMCTAKKSFTAGHYDLTVSLFDDAGNSAGTSVSFDVD